MNLFPESPRVIYGKNPLREVICQIRFPAILKIAETPASFQEAIRATFPVFKQRAAASSFPPDMPPELLRLFAGGDGTIFEFQSRDKHWHVSLYREFLALTCVKYTRWEEFRQFFQTPFSALETVYAPAFYVRIGLRYRNVIHLKELGLQGVAWSELLKPAICGELAENGVRGEVEAASRELVLKWDSKNMVRINHGLGEEIDSYVIDADFFIETEVESTNVQSILDAFNQESGRLFRWAITDRLHTAMQPHPA